MKKPLLLSVWFLCCTNVLIAARTATMQRLLSLAPSMRSQPCCHRTSFVFVLPKKRSIYSLNKKRCDVQRTSCRRIIQRRGSCSVLPAKPVDATKDVLLQKQLLNLEQQIKRANHGQPINVNSPKQVSLAIFGQVQSTSRSVLSQAAANHGEDANQKLAQLVLQHRQLSSHIRQMQQSKSQSASTSSRSGQVAPFSTLPQVDQADKGAEVETTATTPSADLRPVDKDVFQDSSKPTEAATTPYGQMVDGLFGGKSLMDDYWREPLLDVTKPSARAMVAQLNGVICPMGYDPLAVPYDPLRGTSNTEASTTIAGKRGSLLHYFRDQKRRYPDCVLLVRVGDFYESFGLDAVMLVEHCGLNAMAGKARAGCPIRNVQATLDCLTTRGFRVAVYEEAADTDAATGAGATGGSKARLKNRMLAQIVSSASPTYLYDLVLLGNADTLVSSPTSRPHVGIISASSGYTLVEISTEERSVRVTERLTAEAVACRLAAYPPADPLFYVPSPSDYDPLGTVSGTLPFLPSRFDPASDGPGSKLRTNILPPTLMQNPSPGVSNVERAKNTIVSALIKMTEQQDDNNGINPQGRDKVDDFTLLSSESFDTDDVSGGGRTHTNPLHVETATQLGLMFDKTIPSLVSSLLPESSAPAATRRFLRRWLLSPPPPVVADAMSSLVVHLKSHGAALPPLSVPPVGKMLALLRAGQASAQVYGELLAAMDSTIALLDMTNGQHGMVDPLMVLLEYESGLKADPKAVKKRCLEATDLIENVINPLHHAGGVAAIRNGDHVRDQISEFDQLIPSGFFDRNEATWRGRVKVEAAQEAYDKVRESALELARAVAEDFWGCEPRVVDTILEENNMSELEGHLKRRLMDIKYPIVQDIFNNLFALREEPSWASTSDDVLVLDDPTYIHPRDRNGKLLRNRYTTKRVQDALTDYVSACDEACQQVTLVLTKLSRTVCESGHLPAVVQAAHTNLILSTASHHAAKANMMGWNMAQSYEPSGDDDSGPASHFNDIWPYWMDQSQAVKNSFDLKGLFLLTAPNMSGKSTLMRATAAAALLTNCGLCAPVGAESVVARFDSIFVRGASADVPTEQKSAFGAEMEDIAALFRSCGSKSLVFVDELGRGTSPKDGTCIAGAVLEAMANKGMSGIFATHLHGVFNLPLQGPGERIVNKRMAIHEQNDDDGDYVWTYRLEDGICTDSMSLVTAKRFGLPAEILNRAQDLASYMDDSNSNVSSDPQLMVGSSTLPSRSKSGNGIENKAVNGEKDRFEDVVRIAEQVSEQQVHFIRPRWIPPASLEGQSCLYILVLSDNAHTPRYYVGETDALGQRLQQHRAKGGLWAQAQAIAMTVPGGKTQARHVESVMIQKLAKEGLDLQSISDGRRIRRELQ